MHTGQNNHYRRTPNSGNTRSMQSYRGGSTGYRQNNNRSVSPRYQQGSSPLRNNSRGYATHGRNSNIHDPHQLTYHSPSQYRPHHYPTASSPHQDPARVDNYRRHHYTPPSVDTQQHLGAAGSIVSTPALYASPHANVHHDRPSSVASRDDTATNGVSREKACVQQATYEHPLSEEEERAAAKTLPPAQQTTLQAYENAMLRLQKKFIAENNTLVKDVLAMQSETVLKICKSQNNLSLQKFAITENNTFVKDVLAMQSETVLKICKSRVDATGNNLRLQKLVIAENNILVKDVLTTQSETVLKICKSRVDAAGNNLRLQKFVIAENNTLVKDVLTTQSETMLEICKSQRGTKIQEPKAPVEEKKKAIVDVPHDNVDRRNQDRRQRNDDDDNDAFTIHPPARKRACTNGNNVTTERRNRRHENKLYDCNRISRFL